MLRGALGALLGGALLAAALASPAAAQMDSREGIALQNQILELRRDLQALQSQRGGGGGYAPAPLPRGGASGGGGDISAQLLDRVATLEDQVRRLQGQLDEQANANRRAQDDLGKQISDLNFKLQNGAGTATPAPGAASPSSALAAPSQPAAPVKRPPELAMQEGNAALARRDYPAAEAAAREVLTNARSPRAGDAQFLLAQALAGERNWQGSAIAYDDAYSRARTGSRAPDALVGVANALLNLNDKSAACASLEKLRTEFPNPRAEVREGAAAIRGRAGCR